MTHFISLLVGQILAVTFGLFGMQQPIAQNTQKNQSIALPVPQQEHPLTVSPRKSPAIGAKKEVSMPPSTASKSSPLLQIPPSSLTLLKPVAPRPLVPASGIPSPIPAPGSEVPSTEQVPVVQETGNLAVTPEIKNVSQAAVNLVCSQNTQAGTMLISGTGTIIDARGVILTNAHVAEHFLAAHFSPDIDCSVRNVNTGAEYRAEILFLPSLWATKHAGDLSQASEYGTGEDDFSLLVITKRVFSALPAATRFSFIQPETARRASIGQKAYVAGYPAGTGAMSRVKPLPLDIEDSAVSNTLTFSNGEADMLVVPAESVANRGSSGGPVVDENTEKLLGIIVTTAPHQANALALPYLDQEMMKETGGGFAAMLGQDVLQASASFLSSKGAQLYSSLLGK